MIQCSQNKGCGVVSRHPSGGCPVRRVVYALIRSALALGALAGSAGALADPRISLSSTTSLAEFEIAAPRNAEDGLKAEARVTPTFEFELPHQIRLTAIGQFHLDAFDHIEPGEPNDSTTDPMTRRVSIGSQADAELRELYLEALLGNVFLTLGKQQIVWGKADGLKVLDVVNPQTFREFILPEFDDSRIPLWAVNAETRFQSIDVQAILVPDHTYHEIPRSDAAFAITASRFVPPSVPGVPVTQLRARRPNRLLSDADAGVRLATFYKGWDLSLLYFYHYEDIPAARRRITATGVIVTPEYERAHLIGGTFSKAFGDLTVRGEIGYTADRALSVGNPLDADGIDKSDVVAAVVGLDWTGFGDFFISFQMFQDYLLDEPRALFRPEADSTATLFVRRRFLNETVSVELRWLANANDGDGLIRPKISYDIDDALSVWAGADIFYGDGDGIFGQFNSNDRAVFGVAYGF